MPVGHGVGAMQFGALDLLEQHRGDDRLPVLGAQGEVGDDVRDSAAGRWMGGRLEGDCDKGMINSD